MSNPLVDLLDALMRAPAGHELVLTRRIGPETDGEEPFDGIDVAAERRS